MVNDQRRGLEKAPARKLSNGPPNKTLSAVPIAQAEFAPLNRECPSYRSFWKGPGKTVPTPDDLIAAIAGVKSAVTRVYRLHKEKPLRSPDPMLKIALRSGSSGAWLNVGPEAGRLGQRRLRVPLLITGLRSQLIQYERSKLVSLADR